MDNITDIFKTRIKELRGNESQTNVANGIGVSRASLSYYESGDRVPDINVLYSIARYYNVTADYLLGLSDIPKPDIETSAIESVTGLSKSTIDRLKWCKKSFESPDHEQAIYDYLFLQLVNILIGKTYDILDMLVFYVFYGFTHFADFYDDDGEYYYPIENLELFDCRLRETFSEDHDFYSNAFLLRINRDLQDLRLEYQNRLYKVMPVNPDKAEEYTQTDVLNNLKLLFSS